MTNEVLDKLTFLDLNYSYLAAHEPNYETLPPTEPVIGQLERYHSTCVNH